MNKLPPKWMLRMLRAICSDDLFEAVEGDLIHLYNDNLNRKSTWIAKLLFFFNAIQFFQPFAMHNSKTRASMATYKNYFKSIVRNLISNKSFTVINLAGMSLAFAFAIAIYAYVSHELSYDRYHTQADQIYRLTQRIQNNDGYDIHWARTDIPWINELPENFPEIESLVRFQSFRPRRVVVGQEKFLESNAFAVDSEVFNLFNFEFISGNKNALNAPQTIVLTETTATKYFGENNPIGENIDIFDEFTNNRTSYKVTGVIKNQKSNSHIPITFLSSINKVEDRVGWAYVYLLLKPGSSHELLLSKFPEFVALKNEIEGLDITLNLQPVVDIHLHSELSREIKANGNWSYILLFSAVAIFLVLISSVNFANLSMVKSLSKSKEVGVRKVLGADKSQLYIFFMIEAFIMITLSAILGGLTYLLINPWLEGIIGHQLPLDWVEVSFIAMAIIIVVALASSIYPAKLVLKLSIGSSIKGKSAHLPKHTRFRKALVGFQFVIALTLLSGTFLLQRQFSYLTNRQLGYDQEQLLAIDNVPLEVKQNYEVLKSQLKTITGVSDVSAILELPSRPIKDEGRVVIDGRADDEAVTTDIQVMDLNGLALLDIDIIAGTNIPESIRSQKRLPDADEDFQEFLNKKRRAYLINESALKLLGYETPEAAINQQITWSIGPISLGKGPIVGVVRDFHQESLHTKIDPVVFAYEPMWLNNILIKSSSEDYHELIKKIEAAWDEVYPQLPIELTFVDQEVENLYKAEQVQRTLMMIFSIIAIFITMLGLYSIISYTLERRIKEMAIRKVLGAELKSLFGLLSKEYILTTIIGLLICAPLIWLFGQKWLEAYVYRISINGTSIFLSFSILVGILLTTLTFQVIKLNKKNPVDILKIE